MAVEIGQSRRADRPPSARVLRSVAGLCLRWCAGLRCQADLSWLASMHGAERLSCGGYCRLQVLCESSGGDSCACAKPLCAEVLVLMRWVCLFAKFGILHLCRQRMQRDVTKDGSISAASCPPCGRRDRVSRLIVLAHLRCVPSWSLGSSVGVRLERGGQLARSAGCVECRRGRGSYPLRRITPIATLARLDRHPPRQPWPARVSAARHAGELSQTLLGRPAHLGVRLSDSYRLVLHRHLLSLLRRLQARGFRV